jgi:hypothetical protein
MIRDISRGGKSMKYTAGLKLSFLMFALLIICFGCSPSAPAKPVQEPSTSTPASPPVTVPVPAQTPDPAPVAKEVELKYDNDSPYVNLVMTKGGFLVNFDPPSSPFTVKKIKLFGSKGTRINTFQLQIWDTGRNIIFKQSYSDKDFPQPTFSPSNEYLSSSGKWVELAIPDVKASGRFYVHVITNIGGLSLGGDKSAVNGHSGITPYDINNATTEEVPGWSTGDFCGCWRNMKWDQSRTNWMIRAAGTYQPSQK